MSIPRSVADVLGKHVVLEVEGIDRMYLNVYQPKLQTEKQAACFFRFQRGQIAGERASFSSHVLIEVSARQQKRYQHDRGIEISVLGMRRCLEHRHRERQRDTDADRHVHIDAAAAKRPEGRREERRA